MTDDMRMADHHHHPGNLHVETYIEMKSLQPRYVCPYGCNKLIASRTIDYHKNNGCGRRLTDTITSHPELKKRFYCCGACLSEFVTRSEFHAHLRVEHDVHPEVRTMNFPDRQAFDRFKNWLEMEGGAHFRHKSGSKRRNRGKGIFLACNRSGNVSNEKSCASVDRTGPFRLGFTCTAYIHATEHLDGHVTAEVCGDHYGHDARMRLPQAIKYLIAEKQMNHVSSSEIIGFLRNHFMALAGDNIYAQRVCFVDNDELKAIFMSSTKKWAKDGIPHALEVWEEELLDKAGLTWPPSSPRPVYPRPTTADIAMQEGWLRPRVFVAKTRRDDGVLVSFDMTNGESAGEYEQEIETRYIEMEYEEDGYGQDEQMVVEEEEEEEDGEVVDDRREYRHPQMIKETQIIESAQIDVEEGNEVVVTSVDETSHAGIIDQKIQQNQIEEHVVLESPTNEIVIVDGEEEVVDMDHHHHHIPHHQLHLHHHIRHHHQQEQQQEEEHELGVQSESSTLVDQRYIEASKADTLEQIMEEMEQFKHTLLKRANHMTPSNLKSVQIRFQTLHHSIMAKSSLQQQQQHQQQQQQQRRVAESVTVFPNRSKTMYRPGRSLERPEQEYMLPRGDVTLQPIEDDLSDDEALMTETRDQMNWNAHIWG